METGSVHRLKAYGYDLAVDAANGASLLFLRWQKPDARWMEVLHPCPPAFVAKTGGSFVMAPFANRLDAGSFADSRGRVEIPLNRPEQNMAVHGFSRDRPWRIKEATESSVTLVDAFRHEAIPFAYRLVQQISIGPEGVELSLRLTNMADRPLPYGLGFHPWFRKDRHTWLTFDAGTVFDRDDRGFPTKPAPQPKASMFSSGIEVSGMPWFDGHFSGWSSRQAVIEWRAEQARLALSAAGALTNLHVYAPDDQPILCVEPVSHVPDVHNRRELAQYGDITWLARDEVIEGAMRLRIETLAAQDAGPARSNPAG